MGLRFGGVYVMCIWHIDTTQQSQSNAFKRKLCGWSEVFLLLSSPLLVHSSCPPPIMNPVPGGTTSVRSGGHGSRGGAVASECGD